MTFGRGGSHVGLGGVHKYNALASNFNTSWLLFSLVDSTTSFCVLQHIDKIDSLVNGNSGGAIGNYYRAQSRGGDGESARGVRSVRNENRIE